MNSALRALNRFGLGARPGEAKRLHDPREWLHEQLVRAPQPPGAGTASIEERTQAFNSLRTAQQTVRIDSDRSPLEAAVRGIRSITIQDQRSALAQRITSDSPFVERLVAFWSNHFCVAANKQVVSLLAGPYEDEAIRPHVLGRFEDMTLASARHPAMLLYLDNAQSIGPNSRAARRARAGGAERGLNENYARELLELHTVGVDGGYEQADVRELAHVLTGWSVSGLGPRERGQNLSFEFRSVLHEGGARSIMGERFAQRGKAQGEAAIRYLCHHPATAHHICTKLVRHFVADEPPLAAVQKLEDVFLDTEGDLGEVSRALVDLEEAWDPAYLKYRSPQDWLVAVFRALQVTRVERQVVLALNSLRHRMWAPSSPKGYGDTLRDWADPDGLMNRAELSRSIADRINASGMDPEALLEVVDADASSALASVLADTAVPDHDRIALALAAPEFQWR